VVVGGGVVGASILWHLATAGETEVLLVEKHELTAGSTWHAAGNVPTYSNSWLGQRAGNYAWRLWSELADDPDDPITYRHTQAIWPGHTADRMDHFQHLVGIATGLGFDLHLVSPTEIEAVHPFWRDDGTVIAGLCDPYEGDVDPSQLTLGLARRARDLGARVRRHTRVVGIDQRPPRSGSRWLVRCHTADGPLDVECDVVVNAAGFYAGEVSRMVGVEIPLVVLEHQYLVTGPVPGLDAVGETFPLIRDPELMYYLRREQDALLFGDYGHAGQVAWSDGLPAAFDARLFPPAVDGIAASAERAMGHVPVLGDVGVARFVNGPIAYSPDANPLVGPVAGVSGFYQAACVQVGVTQAAAVGRVLTEILTGGETEWDVWSWDPRRFGDWATAGYAEARVCELYEHQYAEPFPHRIWSGGRPVRRTPLAGVLAGRGARFGQVAGWERAFWFADTVGDDHGPPSYRDEGWHDAVRGECEAVRDAVGVMDHGGFTRYEVTGPDAEAFLDRAFCTPLPGPGRVRLAYQLRADGRVWSEATVARLSDDRWLLLGPTAARQRDIDHLRGLAGCWGFDPDGLAIDHGSHRTSTLMVMGPRSRELLQRLTDDDLSAGAAPWMSVRDLRVAGVGATGLRVSFVGELGWELHVDDDDLVGLYGELVTAGADLGVRDFGSYALDSMRVEKAYHGWGSEFGPEYTPFEAGLDRFVAMDGTRAGDAKGDVDFVGRGAVERMRPDRGGSLQEWAFVALTLDGEAHAALPGPPADPAPSAPIRVDGGVRGYATSSTTGHRTGERVVLGFMDGAVADRWDGISVDVLGVLCVATRHAGAVYDPDHRRPNS